MRIEHILNLQQRLFEDRGFQTVALTEEQTKRYGIHGHVANNVVFVRNLAWRPKQ
jgi:hypothetical protein